MRPAARSKTNVMVVVFLLFLFVYTAHNVVYLRINTGFNCLEQMVYDSVQRFYLLQDDPGGMPRMIWQSIGPEGRERSLYEIFCWPFFLLFGVSYQTAVNPNFLFLFLLVFSLYKTGTLMKNREVGCLSAFLVLMYPAIFGFARIYFTTIAAASMVSLCIYYFLSSGFFRSTRKTLLFALCLLVLVKLKMEKSVVYVLLPAGLYLLSGFRRDSIRDRSFVRRVVNIAAGAALFLLLFFVLFSQDFVPGVFGYYLQDIKGFSSSIRTGETFSVITAAAAYLKDLFSIQLGYWGGFLFIIALPYFFRNRVRFKALPVFWIIIPYIFHSGYYWFSGIHSAYYTVQYLPAFALISACGIHSMLFRKGKALKRTGYTVIIALSLLNYASISHFNRQLPLMRMIQSSSFAGKMSMSRIPGENTIFDTAQRLTEALLAVNGSASVVLANHYPSLHWLYGKLCLDNSIRRYKVSLYDYSFRVFSLEPPDGRPVLSRRFSSADLIIDGNKMYPVDSSGSLERYCQFGAYYDFRGVMKNEEEEYYKKIGDMEKIYSIDMGQDKVDFWICREARREFFRKTGRDICASDRTEIRRLIPRTVSEAAVMNSKVEIRSSRKRNSILWNGRELLSFTAVNDRNLSAFGTPVFAVEKTGEGRLVVSKEHEIGRLKQILSMTLEGRRIDVDLEIETRDGVYLKKPFIDFRQRIRRKKRRNEDGGCLRHRFFEFENSAGGFGLYLNREMIMYSSGPRGSGQEPSPLRDRHECFDTYSLLHGKRDFYMPQPAGSRKAVGRLAFPQCCYFAIPPGSSSGEIPGVIVISDAVLLGYFYKGRNFNFSSGDKVFLVDAGGEIRLKPGRFTVFSCTILLCDSEEEFAVEMERLKRAEMPSYRLRKESFFRSFFLSRHS